MHEQSNSLVGVRAWCESSAAQVPDFSELKVEQALVTSSMDRTRTEQ